MKSSAWFAALVLAVLACGSGSALAGGNRMGGTGLYLTQSAEILFEYDRTRLTAEGERTLKQVTADMLEYSEIRFAIEGHADSRGTSSYNKILGLRRAEVVMRSMVNAGIGFDRLKGVTQGEMKPKVPNKDARGMALNRRVHFLAL